MSITVEQANAIVEPLRRAGYSVVIFTPEEVGDCDTDRLEEIMIERGNFFIDAERS